MEVKTSIAMTFQTDKADADQAPAGEGLRKSGEYIRLVLSAVGVNVELLKSPITVSLAATSMDRSW